tara:strand:+ start:222 stop:866 length:645 start_codon:yes stop_codon:yes gene_type:complete
MKKKNNAVNYFIWIVVGLIVVVGAWIFIGNDDSEGGPTPYTIYNGYVIYEIKDENYLRYRVEAHANNGVKYTHHFRTYPTDLLDLDYDLSVREKVLYKDVIGSVRKEKVYFSYNPQMDGIEILSAGTLIQILGTGNAGIFGIPVVVSVTEDINNLDFPIKKCGDATTEISVIEMRYGEPRVYVEGECVVVQGNDREEFIKMNDLLSYIILEVIE